MNSSQIEACLERTSRAEPVTDTAPDIYDYLAAENLDTAKVIETDGNAVVLDLGAGSQMYGQALKGLDVDSLAALVDRAMADAGTEFAFGRYGERRDLYHTENFAGGDQKTGERRDVHMGIDLFCRAGTDVCSPLDGVVEIVANNTAELDYGPMLMVRHRIGNGASFFILYGHLSLSSVRGVNVGDRPSAGDKIAEVGTPPENGNWPPHLHIQVICDLLDLGTDFPGVTCKSQLGMWLSLSPSPAVFFPEVDPQLLNVAASQ